MFKYRYILSFLALWISGMGGLSIQSQNWKLDPESPAKVEISGTSSLHDWKVVCSGIQDVPAKLVLGTENLDKITDFGFKVPVENMDGGRGSSMNTKIFDAFQSSENPFVEYVQNQTATVTRSSDGSFNITSVGTLSMAGNDKSVTVNCLGTISDGVLILTGHHDLKMSEFNMVPPSAMFGQIKNKDDVVVNFELRYILDK